MATRSGNGAEKPVKYECKYENERCIGKISSTYNFGSLLDKLKAFIQMFVRETDRKKSSKKIKI